MQASSILRLRKHWLSLCATVFVLYGIFLTFYVSLYEINALSARLEVVMFLLSFPLGSLFMFLFYSGVGGIGERLLLWPMALVIGYVQWFHLVPMLLARRAASVTTLSLSANDEVASPAEAIESGSTPSEKRQLFNTLDPPSPHFDERGLTPLEKILRERKRQPTRE